MTLDELLTEMRLCERVSVVQLEPRDVARWREALEVGVRVLQVERDAAVAAMKTQAGTPRGPELNAEVAR